LFVILLLTEQEYLASRVMDSGRQGDCKAPYACVLMSEDRCSVQRLIRGIGVLR